MYKDFESWERIHIPSIDLLHGFFSLLRYVL